MVLTRDDYIVGIGASAGGLEAIHEFFDHMPGSANLSFVIIQHLSSDYKSLLVELVSRHTNMKVSEAENNMKIQKNCIYVIPNNKLITIENDKLCLEDKKNLQVPNNAIDTFLYSLAREKKNKAIAVILSGTGSDGTKGIEAIKNNGGMVIVQDPGTAKFNGMPNSAIQSGIADHILAPQEMPEEILNFVRDPGSHEHHNFKEEQLEQVFQLIHNAIGFDFHYYKLPTITRRIARRMMQLGYQDITSYIDFLNNNPEECKHLGNDFLIGVTRFFRDQEAFKLLEEKVLRELVSAKSDLDTIKVWVCACSTGEEAYSIAILLNETIESAGKNIDIKIFATDIDETGIEIASKGVYPASIEKDMSPHLLEKYFTRRNAQYLVSQKIRKQVVFAKHDIIKDPPFINNDLISCRNMLIYINQHLQQKIFPLLLFSLNKNGYLFLGSSEHSSYIRENVEELSAKWKLYKKIKETKIASQYLANITARTENSREYRKTLPANQPGKPKPIWEELKTALTEDINLAAFFIDKSFAIREAVGNYEKLLTLPKKSLQLNLLQMVPTELYFVLSTEIKKVWKEEKVTVLKNLRSKKGDKIVSWQVVIKPAQQYTLVVITEHDIPGTPAHDLNAHEEQHLTKDNYIAALESELEETRHNLNLAVEDLETTNEELQSSNEELLSANEELQSSNEELQSLNEELHTLNTEHQVKIKELVELNDDLNNYFRSTDIAQIFLDKNLRIRKFNPASAAMINFIESDTGRPLSHISNNILYENFIQDVEQVLRKKEIIEKEVQLGNGKNLLMRIMPYLTRDKEMNGIIITFVDITTITQLNNIVRAVLNSSPGSIFAFKAERQGKPIKDFTLQAVNNAAVNFIQKPTSDLAGISLKKDIPQLNRQDLFDQFIKVVETDTTLHKDIYFEESQKWYNLIATKMMDGFVATFSDITSKKRSEQKLKKNYVELVSVKDNLKKANERLELKVNERTRELAASEERFRLVAKATNDALWDWDLVKDTVWWGDTFYKLFSYENTGPTNRNYWISKIHPDDSQETVKSIYDAINNGNAQWSKEYRFIKADGAYAYILDRSYILHDEHGTPYRMLGSMFDVTELKNAEHKLATMNEQLEQKVMERTQELEQINAALELSNNDLQQFASVASHDLQEPLRKIQMFAKIIQESYENEPGNPTLNYVDKIIRASERMRSLITDILNYSRLSANNNTYELTNINELLQGILDDFELTIKDKSAIVEIDAIPMLEVNPGQIRQVFQNLISNALKFTKTSGTPVIKIICQRLAKRSFMSMEQENGPYCLISISDNGIGFDPEFTVNIFNLFQRLHSKDKYEGTGIGLAITKKIVEKHNGLIRANSKENEGATFSLILPVRQTQ